MALVYRLVPDSVLMTLTTRRMGDVREDLLYKLGMMDSCSYNYFGLYREGIGMVEEGGYKKQMFFFDSPWSCIRALEFLRSYYTGRNGARLARIMEYDIPDDIINSGDKCFTNYENFQAKGRLIDIELLSDGQIQREMDKDMAFKLDSIAKVDEEETLVALEMLFGLRDKEKVKKYLTENWHTLMETRLGSKPYFWSSTMPTGRVMGVTKRDYELFMDVIFNKKKVDDLKELMQRSRGMLNPENWDRYDFDSPTHRYCDLYF